MAVYRDKVITVKLKPDVICQLRRRVCRQIGLEAHPHCMRRCSSLDMQARVRSAFAMSPSRDVSKAGLDFHTKARGVWDSLKWLKDG